MTLIPHKVYEVNVYLDISDLVLAFCAFLEAMTQSAYVITISINDVSFQERKKESLKEREKSKNVYNEKIVCWRGRQQLLKIL